MDIMTNLLLEWLLQTSLHASVIILLILGVRFMFKSRFRPGWSQVLWLILICSMIMPEPLVLKLPDYLHTIHPLGLSQDFTPTASLISASTESSSSPQFQSSTDFSKQTIHHQTRSGAWLFYIWLLGAVLLICLYTRKLLITYRHINLCNIIEDPTTLNCLNQVKRKLNFSRNIVIKRSKMITSPACFGLFKPVILLPATDLQQDRLSLILEHELLHHKRLDIAADALMTLLKCIHWFNPLVWIAHRVMRHDCELSCDYRVTRFKSQDLKHLYASLLIEFAGQRHGPRNAYSVTLMSANFSILSTRIQQLIAQPVSTFTKTLQICLIALSIALVSLTAPAATLVIEKIGFDYSVSQGISTFANQRQHKSIAIKNQAHKKISGLLSRPPAKGKHPAIVLIHGCEGFDSRHAKWVRHLNEMGYVTLRIQRQGLTTPYCEKPIAQINTLTAVQIMDAYAALDYLLKQEFVDADNVNIMSWESWGAIGAAATYGIGQVYRSRFNSAIAMYPDCTATYNGDFDMPLLIMVGDSDQWAQSQDCISIQTMAGKTNTPPVKVKVYADTFHGFDHQGIRQATFLPYAKNLGHLSTTGATAKFNPHAYLDARLRLKTFLNENFTRNE